MRVLLLYLVHPWDRLPGFCLRGQWRLRGYDAFAEEWRPRPGRYVTAKAARRAGLLALRGLERTQPAATSGGQGPDGIQDRFFAGSRRGSTAAASR
ncbi:MAG: hypothetical protein FJ128_02310 [Deltaproteobacteria bacterium]|nr:hypothetical protein [Deltaproteobacteria bacterium]